MWKKQTQQKNLGKITMIHIHFSKGQIAVTEINNSNKNEIFQVISILQEYAMRLVCMSTSKFQLFSITLLSQVHEENTFLVQIN